MKKRGEEESSMGVESSLGVLAPFQSGSLQRGTSSGG